MKFELHPSQFQHYLWANLQSTVATWGLILAIAGLLVGGTLARPPGLKSLLFGLAWAAGLTAGPIRKIAIATERINNDMDDISLTALQEFVYQGLRERESLGQAVIDVESSEVLPELPRYDPSEVGKAHHTIIAGPTGAGKSELVKWLVSRFFKDSRVRVYDCDCPPWDWQGLDVIGRGGDFISISGAMLEDLKLLDKRCKLQNQGDRSWGEEVRICEEFPAVSAELSELIEGKKSSVAAHWLKRIARRGRKYKIKLILVTQETSVAAMGIEGEGGVRKAFTIFYLGAAALEQAEKLRSKDKALAVSLLAYLQRCARPCLVDHKGRFYVVDIPEIPQLPASFQATSSQLPAQAPTILEPPAAESTSDLRKSLEAIYQTSSTLEPPAAEVTSDQDDFALYQAITALMEVGNDGTPGKSKTWIVENVLGYRGRRFKAGLKRLDELLKRWSQ